MAINRPFSVRPHIPGIFDNQHPQIGTTFYPPAKIVPILSGTRGVDTPAGDMYADK